jgi:serine/threonine protein phosphatase 1
MSGRLFAIGDIHGCIRQLTEIVEEKIRPDNDDTIILLGDYIDRGPEIKAVTDYIINLSGKGYNLRSLIGNHELMMLNSIRTGDMALWFMNGGESTLDSFGIRHPGDLESKYIQFFSNLLWYFEYENYLFVHAGFNDNAADPFEDRYSMVWVRTEHYSNPLLKNRIIIHGHTPIKSTECIKAVRQNKKVINIDTGCVYSSPEYGVLTAIELKSRTLHFVR